MNDKAQAMIDELVAACIEFGRQAEPDWQARLKKARQELREYIADLEELIEKLVDEGCVIAERFSVKGGSEADLEDWENVIDEYKAVMPEVTE